MGILLDGSGYVANQTQSDATLNWLLILAFVIPAVVTIIHFVLQMFYGLNDKRLDECMQEVRERRKGEKIMAKKLFTTIYGRNLVESFGCRPQSGIYREMFDRLLISLHFHP